MTKVSRNKFSPLGCWLWLCALLNLAGWTLSAFHALNWMGYAAVFALVAAAGFYWRKELGLARWPRCHPARWRRRFKRLFPAAFLAIAGLALLGGVLHAPNNYDALAYRVPRVLHWLAAEQWHWIHTDFPRLNNRACGFEWVAAPLVLFTKSDRLLFLINVLSFLLLPGLFFSLLRRVGVRRREAWHWMWLLPTGTGCLLQAGGIGNDLYGAVFALAAVDCALRARGDQTPRDFWLSLLAAALLTGGKTSNLPLLLPWAVAIAPSLRIALRRPLATAAVCVVAAAASLAPVGWMNWKHLGDWTGLAAEGLQLGKGEPAVRLANNAALLTVQNFVPPIFPFAGAWNRAVPRFLPAAFTKKVESDFEPGAAHWQLGEMEMEEGAGLGFGVSLLLLVSLVAALCRRRFHPAAYRSHELGGDVAPAFPPASSPGVPSSSEPLPPLATGTDCATQGLFRMLLLTSVWLALLVFMLKSNLSSAARLALPYYGLLIPGLLLSRGHAHVVKAIWWQRCATAVFVLAGVVLVVSPARPLWPAQTILAGLGADAASGGLLARAQSVYAVYARRWDSFQPIRIRLPAEAKRLGFVSTDEPETSLWRPFGSRRVLHVSPTDSAAELRERGIEYVLVSGETWSRLTRQTLESWLAGHNAAVTERFSLTLRASGGPADWDLIKLLPPASKDSSGKPPRP